MLDGLVVQTHPIDTVIVVDNASGDHTQQVLARDDLPLPGDPQRGERRRRGRLPDRHGDGVRRWLGPHLADGRRRGAGARLPGRADGRRRRALRLPDVRPRGPRGAPGREVRDHLRPAQPAGDQAQDGERRDDVRDPRRDAAAGGDRGGGVRGLPRAPPGGRRASGCPTRSSSSSTTTRTSPCVPARPASGSGPCATPSSSGSWRSRSSTRWRRGRASTCTATSSWCTSATGRTRWCGPSRTRSPPPWWRSARCVAAARRRAM